MEALPFSPHMDSSRSAQVLLRPPRGPNLSPLGSGNPSSPQTKSLGSLPLLPPPQSPMHRAEVASSGESRWLECSSAVLFFLGYSRGCGNSHGCGEGKPPSPLPSSWERGEAQAPWSWVGPATVVPGPGGLRAEDGAPGRVGRAPRRGSGFFIKSHEADPHEAQPRGVWGTQSPDGGPGPAWPVGGSNGRDGAYGEEEGTKRRTKREVGPGGSAGRRGTAPSPAQAPSRGVRKVKNPRECDRQEGPGRAVPAGRAHGAARVHSDLDAGCTVRVENRGPGRAGRAGRVTAWSGPPGCRSRCCRRSRWPSCGGRRRRA